MPAVLEVKELWLQNKRIQDILIMSGNEASSAYWQSLRSPERAKYLHKLQCLYGITTQSEVETAAALDPYGFSDSDWHDDLLMWPPVEFGHIFCYLVDTPGEFTREKLLSYKSLEAYNYYARFVHFN